LLRQLTTANEKITEWEAAAVKWFASPEAKQQLDGYRELGARAAAAENALAAANERARKLQDRLDMFSESNEARAAEITRLATDTRGQVGTLTTDLVAANERAGRMEEALEFYAKEEYYTRYSPPNGPPYPSTVTDDNGDRARQALKEGAR
jgi:hypothetical protein